jgi:zinc finger protein
MTSDYASSGGTQSITLLSREVIRCPQCGYEGLEISIYLYNAPCIGNTIIEAGRCPFCGLLYRDIYVAEYGERRRFEVKVTRGSDDYLLIKSSSATVVIPELGVEIAPGPAALGYITTARGILEKVLEVLSIACTETTEECQRRMEDVRKALEGEFEYTLIVDDPLGRSLVVKLGERGCETRSR